MNFIIPSIKNYPAIFVMGVWLAFWAYSEAVVAITVFQPNPNPNNHNLGSFLFFWTIGGGYILQRFLWQLFGKENVEVGCDSIKLQSSLFGFGRTKNYLATHIKNLRVAYLPIDYLSRSHWWGFVDGNIAFEYDSKTIYFGSGTNEIKANQIFEEIISRFPQYRA